MAANGADLIELGIPFSDPTAEGPVIQEANLRAPSGRGDHRPGVCPGAGSPPGRDGPPGVHDLRQRGLYLRGGGLCPLPIGGGWMGSSSPTCPMRRRGVPGRLPEARGGADLHDRPHLRRPHCQDCPGGGGVPLPGLQPGGSRGAAGHHHRPGRHPPGDPREYGPALCHRLWHRPPPTRPGRWPRWRTGPL